MREKEYVEKIMYCMCARFRSNSTGSWHYTYICIVIFPFSIYLRTRSIPLRYMSAKAQYSSFKDEWGAKKAFVKGVFPPGKKSWG